MPLYYQGVIFELPDINKNCAQDHKRLCDSMLEEAEKEKYKQLLYAGEKRVCYIDFHKDLVNQLNKLKSDEELFSLALVDSDEVVSSLPVADSDEVVSSLPVADSDEVVFEGTSVEDSHQVVHNKLVAKLLWMVHS
jgi:hypothetical protein